MAGQARDPVTLRPGQSRGRLSAQQLVEQGGRVRDDVGALAADAREIARNGEAMIRERLEQQPYATLAVAAGLGYILGGGLPVTLVRAAVALGGRFALERVLVQLVHPTTQADAAAES